MHIFQHCIVDEKLENINYSVNEVRRHLLKLNPNKSPGLDQHCAMYFKIMCSGTGSLLPEDWENADITPLHRKGSKSSSENYCPISLTSIDQRKNCF